MEIGEKEGQHHKPVSWRYIQELLNSTCWYVQEGGKLFIAQLEVGELLLSCIYLN